jgi:Na+/proline symporter/signal transduction histidine kinase
MDYNIKFDVDIAIVITFLILTLAVGLGHGKYVKNIKDYALGGRNFSTAALVATIVATYASGSGFFVTLSKTYSGGFYYVLARFGLGAYFLIVSLILIPRMAEFLGKISIAEAMGDLYGQRVRVITAIAGTIGGIGAIAVQFKVFGSLFAYFFHFPSYIAIIGAGLITTIYSAFGGIRAVTFTDILQFFAFGAIIPLVGFVIWNSFYYEGLTLSQAVNNPKFNFYSIFSSTPSELFGMIVIFVYFAIPTMSAATFQRIAIGNNIAQVKKAFFIASIILILIQIITAWIPFLVYTMKPSLNANNLLSYIVETYSYTGFKGLILVAVIAFAMSTADSRINAASVLFTNDICKVFIKNLKNEMFISRLFAFCLGAGAVLLSLLESDLLSIVVLANSFYYPLVTPPFLLTVFGFRSSAKSVLIGMAVGFIVTIIWQIVPIHFENISQKIIGLFVAMLCNAFFLIISHYLLKQKGGWVGIKDQKSFDKQRLQTREKRKEFIHSISRFNIKNYLKKQVPHNHMTYTMLGIYFIVCTLTTMYSTHAALLEEGSKVLFIIYQIMLITSTIISMHLLWPLSIKQKIKDIIIRTWAPIATFYMLIFFSCFFVLVSKFAIIQIALFVLNIVIVSMLFGWLASLILIPIGCYFSISFFQFCFGIDKFQISFGSPEFMLIYLLLIVGIVLLIFIKPKEERQEASDIKVDTLETEVTHLDDEVTHLTTEVTDLNKKVDHYSERVSDQNKEIERLGATAQKILNNVNHELRLPVGNVMNFAEMLNEGLEKFNPEQLKMLSDEVYKNSNRLSSMIMNMLDLAALEAKNLELDKSTTNLSALVRERVQSCRKMYLDKKEIDFEIKIENELLIKIDPNYIRQTVDNLIINAINFSEKGVIKISLLRKKNIIEFIIQDEGIGIPQEDIYDIFTPFKMGSNTESKAEGRGVGLALCKAAIEAHGGIITVDSKGKGAIFSFVLSIEDK